MHNLFNGALFTAQRSSVVLVNLTSVDDLFSNLGTDASTGVVHNFNDFLFDSRNILCRHTVHPSGEPAQWSPQSKLWNFDKMLAEVVSLALALESAPLRLIICYHSCLR